VDELRDGRKDLPIFIHSELDEYGLDPFEFRIYSRLSRRAGNGDTMESVPRMAQATRMSERKVRYALKLLFQAGLIEKHRRSGRSNVITLTPKGRWSPKESLRQLRREVTENHSDGNLNNEGLAEAKESRSHTKRSTEAKKLYPPKPTPAPGAGVAEEAGPLHLVHDTPAPGAGVMEYSPRLGSPGETTNTNTSSARACDVFDERLIAELQQKPAYSHLDVAFVRDKMVAHCERTNKSVDLERLESWLNREYGPARSEQHAKRESPTRRRESASERNARQHLRSIQLLSRARKR
jgi:DNA-binding transcriptional ArsR family regulator